MSYEFSSCILRANCLPRNKKKSTQNDYDDTWLLLANTRSRWNTCDRLLNTNHYCVSYAKNYKDIKIFARYIYIYVNFQIRSNFTIIDQHWILRCACVPRNSFMKFCSLRTTLPSFRDESRGRQATTTSNKATYNIWIFWNKRRSHSFQLRNYS